MARSVVEATPGARAARVASLDLTEREALLSLEGAERDALVSALVAAVEDGGGESHARLALGVLLGELGDPRLLTHEDPAYWAELDAPDGSRFALGRMLVTNAAYRAFVDAGSYEDPSLWSIEGRAWLAETDNPWPVLADGDGADGFVTPNQPVVGVSFYEAEAFARWAGARLPTWVERVYAVRGEAKRPYPWGSPFGEGHANTREESLERPCAVGLYRSDCTPEGVFDLAGNVGEWTAEPVGDEVLIHPGSWEQPSLASWAKASTTASPGARWSALGFRLAKDR